MRAIDLFAGWGGFTEGAEQAGVEVLWAANHWPLAVKAHGDNHPKTTHSCQDLKQADWTKVPHYDLLLASPACQGHSPAGQPGRAQSDRTRRHHDELRATSLAIIDCADITEPKAIIIENVPRFRRWRLYDWWLEGLGKLGYKVTQHIVRASHHDVPQRRDRLFIIAMKDRSFEYEAPRVAEPGFGPYVQWEKGKWKPFSVATPPARARLDAGRKRFGDRFIVHHVTGHKGISLEDPLRTVTTKDQWAAVNGKFYRPLTLRENARAMGFPDDYEWPKPGLVGPDGKKIKRGDIIRGLGNAVCPPVAKHMVSSVMEAM